MTLAGAITTLMAFAAAAIVLHLVGGIRRQLSKVRLELDCVLLAQGRFLRDAPNATRGCWTRYASINDTVAF